MVCDLFKKEDMQVNNNFYNIKEVGTKISRGMRVYVIFTMQPLSLYILFLGSQILFEQFLSLLIGIMFAIIPGQLIHQLFSKNLFKRIDLLFQKENDVTKLKNLILKIPYYEMLFVIPTWISVTLYSFIYFYFVFELNSFAIASILVTMAINIIYSTVLNYLVAERISYALFKHPLLQNEIILNENKISQLSEGKRQLFINMVVVLLPSIILIFFLVLSNNHGIHFDNIAWHFTTIILFLVLVIASLAYESTKNFDANISLMEKTVENLQKGKISNVPQPLTTNSEIGFLTQDLSFFQLQLHEAISTLALASQAIHTGEQKVYNAIYKISSSALEQAQNVQETSSALTEIYSMLNETTKESQHTLTIVQETVAHSEESKSLLSSVVERMRSMTEKINLIESIATQTNLLSLNASIEAARTSEKGKGFSVVAHEIGELAENSRTSANSISEIIHSTLDAGESANNIFKQILPILEKIAHQFQEIVNSAKQEKLGIEQINIKMDKLNEIAKNNSIYSDQLETVAKNMKSSSDNLFEQVGFFQLDN